MPKKTPKTDALKEAPKAEAPKKASGKRILIVEDEKPLAHALELKMKHEGYDVQTANTGAEGLKLALEGTYALLLLDIIMPEVDGFTLLEELRAKQIKTPAIVLSNLGQDEDRERAKSLGAIEYFVKANTPIAEIVAKVKSVL
jgi:DNA-binding response OmpR family regulator